MSKLTVKVLVIGDQFIEPCGFSGSLPLLFAMFWLLFVLIAVNTLLVGWLVGCSYLISWVVEKTARTSVLLY